MEFPTKLSLDCKPHYFSMLLKSFGDQNDDQTQKLEEFLSCLDEERVKIDAFKRELPLCIQLLNNAAEKSKELLQTYKENSHQPKQKPVLEEFIPITTQHLDSEETEKVAPNTSDKANWMTNTQLWCQSSTSNNEDSTITSTQETDSQLINFKMDSPKLNLDAKQRNGGAFVPFCKDRSSRVVCDLGLNVSNEKEIGDKRCCELSNHHNSNGGVVNEQVKTETDTTIIEATITTSGDTTNNNSNNQTRRKARRCWSPELHRRFVNALQMLGGSQVATPKQIRELMKVDGLTNDEVKSHLQKYRLHTRRPNCPGQQTTPAPQLVVLGGIWVPQEYASSYNAAHHASHAPSHFYLPPVVPSSHHSSILPLTHHVYNSSSSPMEFEGKAKVERSETVEDGEESNGSEITLKF